MPTLHLLSPLLTVLYACFIGETSKLLRGSMTKQSHSGIMVELAFSLRIFTVLCHRDKGIWPGLSEASSQ